MRLSDAIRAGAKLRPRQVYGELFDGIDGSCAIGAATEGIGLAPVDSCKNRSEFWQRFPAIIDDIPSQKCVACSKTVAPDGLGFDDLEDHIVHLNDDHRWTREAIADWLDTLDADPVSEEFNRVATEAALVPALVRAEKV